MNFTMTKKQKLGHAAAILCAMIWGTTFISTKILLQDFTPLEILVFRFIAGYATLWIACPRFLKVREKKHELYFLAAGATGVSIYYLMENVALTYTLASNVSIIVSIAPFLTALLAHITLKDEKLHLKFAAGFLVAILGVALVSFNGSAVLKLNPIGDILAVGAAVVWAFYSIIIRKTGALQYPVILVTRRIFFYGILIMVPMVSFMDFSWKFAPLADPVNLFNLIFLSVFACALGFVIWNYAVDAIGAVATSNYIYAIPVVTVITSVIILKEPLTFMAVCGMALTIAGLVLSSYKGKRKH